jgi:hypothetical protein
MIKMEIKIKINEKTTVLLEVEQEMSVAEFMGVTSIISKLYTYAMNQKQIVNEIINEIMPRKRTKHIRVDDEEKKKMIKEWGNTKTKKERDNIAKKYGVQDSNVYSKKIHYYKRVLNLVEK